MKYVLNSSSCTQLPMHVLSTYYNNAMYSCFSTEGDVMDAEIGYMVFYIDDDRDLDAAVGFWVRRITFIVLLRILFLWSI